MLINCQLLCYGIRPYDFVPQYWMMSKEGEIRRDEACLDFAGVNVTLYPCHGSRGNQHWIYIPQVNWVLV